MTNPSHFLRHAEVYHSQNEVLYAGLHLESAFWAATAHGSYHAETHLDTLTVIHALAGKFSQPLQHYTQLLNTAKNLALEMRRRAYAPFSKFLVGAALLADDESLLTGCNVESSSYGLTICAERTALVSGVAQGKTRFAGVVVAADTLTPPCGACRQMLYDFAPDALVVLVNPRGAEKRFTMKELLPEAFSSVFLE